MNLKRGSILTMLSVPLIAIGLAACGGGGSSSASNMAGAAQTTGAANTVSTKPVSGVGTVLVDSKGDVLYTNNRDSGANVACDGQCMSIWPALMAPSNGQPTSSNAAVMAKLGVIKGSNQVTYNGTPLYTFVQDRPGQATGNGAMDSFGGTSFTWTAAAVSGAAAASSSTSSGSTGSASSGGGSSGGYGY
jgi:predicted lipoprotein with Yx(FWY)xxD motif